MNLNEFLLWMEDACDTECPADAAALATARTLVRIHDFLVMGVAPDVRMREISALGVARCGCEKPEAARAAARAKEDSMSQPIRVTAVVSLDNERRGRPEPAGPHSDAGSVAGPTERTLATPWGPAEKVTPVLPGVEFVSALGHGGYRVSPEARARMMRYRDFPAEVTAEGCSWWEEDCEWAFLVLGLPGLLETFPSHRREELRTTAEALAGSAGVWEFARQRAACRW